MDLLLTSEQGLLADSAAKLCRTFGGWRRARERFRDARVLDSQAAGEAAKAGWLALLVHEAAGGSGLGAFELALIAKEIGRHAFGVPLVSIAAAAWGLAACGRDAAGGMPGSRLTVAALNGDGSAFRTDGELPRASPLDGGICLNGAHKAVPALAAAQAILASAVDDRGVLILCWLPTDAPGLSVVRTGTLGLADTGDLHFSRTPALVVMPGPRAASVARAIHTYQMIGFSAELLGLGLAALDLALEHLKSRKQFGRLIGSFQALQHRAADCFVALELLCALLFRTASDVDKGCAHAAMLPALKAKAGSTTLSAVRFALQVHGAMGYTDEHDIGLMFKRAIALDLLLGNEAYQFSHFQDLTS